jgi:hypothetical protein
MSRKLKIDKIENFFKKLPWILAGHAFLSFLLLFIIILIVSAIIFYKYSILVQKIEPNVTEKSLQFKKGDYQKVLEIWQERDKKFQEAKSDIFPNPFQGTKSEPSATPTATPIVTSTPTPIQELQSSIPLQNLQTAINLYKFYLLKGETLPPIGDRAKLWEELGFGKASEYYGSNYQNQKLLDELKKIFTSGQ